VGEWEESEGETRASRAGAPADKLQLLLSQPEIVAWLDMSELEVIAWLGRSEDPDEDDEARVA
jgi:hypothetical protein